MAGKRSRISPESWNLHKETILGLYITSEISGDELVETMERDYGFAATISQYEAQLRTWNARKNLKKFEWEAILPKIDYLSSQGIQARVVISGHPVSTDRVRRAKRHCKSDLPSKKRRRMEGDPREVDDCLLKTVSIEVQDSSGNWTLYEDSANEAMPSHQQSTGISEVAEFATQEVQLEVESTLPVSCFGIAELSTPSTISPGPWSYPIPNLATFVNDNDRVLSQTAGVVTRVPQSPPSYDLNLDITDATLQLMNPEPQLNNMTQFPFSSGFLNDLPFEQFEREHLSKSIQLTSFTSPMQESSLLSGAQNPAAIFFLEVAAAMTNTNGKPIAKTYVDARQTLRTLDTIIADPRLYCRNGSMAWHSQKNYETEICRILLSSTVNGFCGLDGIPLEVVPRFLSQNTNVIGLLPHLFQNKPTHVTRAIAENLFRAWVEYGDHQAIREVVKTGLVNIHEIACFIGGEKYTPLERLAELQHIQAIHELLQFNPDVNRTFTKDTDPDMACHDHKGALGHLIKGIAPEEYGGRSHSAFSQEWLNMVDCLIRSGAAVRVGLVLRAFIQFVRTDLAEKLLREVPPNNRIDFIRGMHGRSGLDLIVEKLTDEKAKNAFDKLLFDDCEQGGCNRFLTQYCIDIQSAIARAAERGHIQLVRSYLQYVGYPAEVLTAAIRSGSREIVQLILERNPPIHISRWHRLRYGTLLSEAIRAGDKDLVRELEIRGALGHLDEMDQISLALSAAAGVGDLEYVKKLLLLNPEYKGEYLIRALWDAGKNEHEDVVRFLLDAGVEFSYMDPPKFGVGDMMEFFVKTTKNMPLWSHFVSFYPITNLKRFLYNHNCSCPLGRAMHRNIDMIDSSLGASLLDRRVLTEYLPIAFQRHDCAMLRRLFELGADALGINEYDLDGENLHVDLLRIWFQYVPSTEKSIPQFGTQSLAKVIQETSNGTEILDLFLECKAIDFRSLSAFRPSYSDPRVSRIQASPLGAAITRDAENHQQAFPLTTRLLDAGCDINGIIFTDCDECGRRRNWTPLLKAIETKNRFMVQFLIDCGAQINTKAILGIKRTPLQAAAEKCNLEIVKLLIEKGADVNGKPANFHGRTALQCAAMSGNCNIAALLLDFCADLFAPPSEFGGRWPIEAAAEYGRLDMIKLLWNASRGGFPIEQCREAMRLAKENTHGACVDLIRELAVSNGIVLTLEGTK